MDETCLAMGKEEAQAIMALLFSRDPAIEQAVQTLLEAIRHSAPKQQYLPVNNDLDSSTGERRAKRLLKVRRLYASAGIQLARTHPEDGPERFIVAVNGEVRIFSSLDAVHAHCAGDLALGLENKS